MSQQQQASADTSLGEGRTPAIEVQQPVVGPEDGGPALAGNAATQDAHGLGQSVGAPGGGDEHSHEHSHEQDDNAGGSDLSPMVGSDVMVKRGGGNYTVKRGDTLSEIARVTYGKTSFWTRIRDANPGQVTGGDIIRVGAVLALPEIEVPATGSPSAVGGVWTVESLITTLNQGTGRAALQKIVNDGIKIVRFDTAFDIWEYDADGRRENEELTGLRGNTDHTQRTIRIRTNLSDQAAALTLFHELNHWGRPATNTQQEYLDEEVDVRRKTEEFAISAKMPALRPEYRNPDGTINQQAIKDSVYNSQHYNPTGRHRVGREYAGEVETSGVEGPVMAIEGIVTAWKVGAMRDHGEDTFAVYDAAEVRITAPLERAGLLLTLYAEQPTSPDLLWRETGAAVCFELRPEDLTPGRQVFVAAARNVHRC